MDSLFTLGFPAALAWQSLGLCFMGTLAGMLLGVLLGIGPITAIAILLPFAFGANVSSAIALLAGIYCGAQYGSSVTAVLFGVPGGASAIVTTRDGNPLARQGRAGVALGIVVLASFIACTIATVVIAVMAGSLSRLPLLFGPADYAALLVLTMALAATLAGGSISKALAMVVLGVLLAMVGTDLETGDVRQTFGLGALSHGLSPAVVTVGLIGFTSILLRFENAISQDDPQSAVGPLLPLRTDLEVSAWPILRGSAVGAVLGWLPGGALLAPFASYRLEQAMASNRAQLGEGAVEGVAGPEAANNAGAMAAIVLLMTLGFSHNTVMAMMLGTLTISGATPGPQLLPGRPELFWGMIASLWIASLMVSVVGLALVGAWVKLLLVPRRLLLGALALFGFIGIYAIANSLTDVGIAAAFGLLGYGLVKRGFEPMPLLIGFLFGRVAEEQLRQALVISRGSFMTFIDRPLSASLLVITLLVLVGACGLRRHGRKSAGTAADRECA